MMMEYGFVKCASVSDAEKQKLVMINELGVPIP